MNVESPQPDDPSGADLCGLPHRSHSTARDRLEEIASEYLERLRKKETVDVNEYFQRYPKLEAELREFLPLVGAMEDWKIQREFNSIRHSLPDKFELTQLGEFRILREIARGGMGVVFEAEQPALNRRVAVKLLPWQFPKKSTWSEQFLREARLAASLQHAQIVPVYSFGEQNSRFYYAMQLIEGVGLDKLIERWSRNHGIVSIDDLIGEFHPHLPINPSLSASKRLLRHDSWMQLAKIATQIVSALRYAHKQGVLHRDIKPANILIDRHGKIWITDFGLAMGQETLLTSSNIPLSGTLRYMSPEQLKRSGDLRSDLYSFGVTLYELCTLKPAFSGKEKTELIQEIESGKFIPPRSVNPSIPVALEKIIKKCLKENADDRYQNADQLYADLLRFLNGDSPVGEASWWQKLMGKKPNRRK
ncbi:MAG TPA: serine/threonine-protein kinase [Planctomicrobium sp.]|nr:serine/threonine-protein kinase [Planctomicrobium sp.]